MQSAFLRVVSVLVVFLLSIQTPIASAEEAKQVFDSLFAAKIKAVGATIERDILEGIDSHEVVGQH